MRLHSLQTHFILHVENKYDDVCVKEMRFVCYMEIRDTYLFKLSTHCSDIKFKDQSFTILIVICFIYFIEENMYCYDHWNSRSQETSKIFTSSIIKKLTLRYNEMIIFVL